MEIFKAFRMNDIHHGLAEYRQQTGALLLDVRTPEEYRQGHIPGSKNVPLQTIDKWDCLTENEDTPIYVYCHSGARSRQAVRLLNQMGHHNVTNLGGIICYQGELAQ